MRWLRRFFWLALLVAAIVGLWLFSRGQPVPADVGVVERGRVRAHVEEEGRTRVRERYVVSAPVAGRLLRVGLEEGDEVIEGQLLAEIDPLSLESRVERTEAEIRALRARLSGVERLKPKAAELDRARVLERVARDAVAVAQRELEQANATLAEAARDLERVRALVRSGSAPDEDLDAVVAAETRAREAARAAEIRVRIRELEIEAAKLETRVLEARLGDYDWQEADYEQQIQALEASLKSLRDDLKRAHITAPVSGIVLNLLTESEQVVAAGAPILELGDLDRMEVIADFLSEDVAHMRAGMRVELFGRALGDRVVPGRIMRVYPSAFEKISSLGVEQQRVNIVVAFDARLARLGDRFRVEMRVILDEREDVVLVPEGALFRHEDAWHVFRVVDGVAVLTKVETGLRDGRVREVRTGLEPGDRVVLHPEDAVENGARIEALEE